MIFDDEFRELTGFSPLPWQKRLHSEFLTGNIPSALDLPTGLGKTSVIPIWYLAKKHGGELPTRLIYVVDRRVVVDQATSVADKIKESSKDADLSVSTLRGQHIDNREWLKNPAKPSIIVGTVDMIGSRLLFSGYGVSPKMRPFHAGLIGCDSLIVLDESHLVPSFQALLDTIVENALEFGPTSESGKNIIPEMKLLSLSATGRNNRENVFQLNGDDKQNQIVKKRLNATKNLEIVDFDGKNLHKLLAKEALKLSEKGKKPIRCIIFCDSKNVADKTGTELVKTISEENVELLVGGRRVMERNEAERKLHELGFLGEKTQKMATFLIATSAGEVGIDIDADAMVCDVVPFERMVQRLGRVNRRGNLAVSKVVLLHCSKSEEERKVVELLKNSPYENGHYDISLNALMELGSKVGQDKILEASTPENYRPRLTRTFVDMWSMTSLGKLPAMPDVKNWIRGWTDDEPQIKIIWRKYLPMKKISDSEQKAEGNFAEYEEMSKSEVQKFFDAVPPHLSEQLEERTTIVIDWLQERIKLSKTLNENDPIAFLLAPDGSFNKSYSMKEIKYKNKYLTSELGTGTLIIDYRIGGLTNGLLVEDSSNVVKTADDSEEWLGESGEVVGFNIYETEPEDWTHSFVILESEEESLGKHLYVQSRSTEFGEAFKKSLQTLLEHEKKIKECMHQICLGLNLNDEYASMLNFVCEMHDKGKDVNSWQEAFNAPPNGGPYAKTPGPVNANRLGGYRHELGSVIKVKSENLPANLEVEFYDLIFHLIGAHHGNSRPTIQTKGCENLLPSKLNELKVEIINRYAKLQRQWGPWGLAWLESLVRAADHQASKEDAE